MDRNVWKAAEKWIDFNKIISTSLCVLLFFPFVMKRFSVLILNSISPRGICCVFLFYENWNFVSKYWSWNVAPSSKKRGQHEILSSVDVVSLLQLYCIFFPHHFCSFNHIRFVRPKGHLLVGLVCSSVFSFNILLGR